MFKLLYFCMAGGILIFSVIVVNIAPAINNLVDSQSWSQYSCKYLADKLKITKDSKVCDSSDCDYNTQDEKDYAVDDAKMDKTQCERRQAMVGLEYASLNCNLVFGFICALLGFFLFFNIGDVGKIASFAGLGAGIVGFVLTFVYVIESGLVFNSASDITDDNGYRIPRLASDGSFLEWDDSKKTYTCKFYKKKNHESVYLRFSNYRNKFLNYYKDLYFNPDKLKEEIGCRLDNVYGINRQNYPITYKNCKTVDEASSPYSFARKTYDGDKNCDKIYYISDTTDNQYKVIYDRWLTTIILSCFIMLLDIGLAIFGFLVNSGSKGTGY